MSQPAPDPGPRPARGPRPDLPSGPGSLLLPEEDFVLFEIFQRLWRSWRVIAATTFVAGLLTVGLAYLVRERWTATTSFMPEQSSPGGVSRALSGLGGLAGLASRFGISIGGDAESPRFYANLIGSRTLRERLLFSKFADPRPDAAPGDSAMLLTLLRVRGRDRADSIERAIKRVRGRVDVKIDNQTRMVHVSVWSRYGVLSAAVANRIVQYVNEFNAQTRQSRARERRRFVEERLSAVADTLRQAEDRLRRFYEKNRAWSQETEMGFERDRLQRQVDVARELYLSLRQEFESARIEEVNDTPVLTVIDPAVPPARRSFPRRKVMLAIGLMFGGLVGVLWVLAADYWRRARAGVAGAPG